MSDNLATARITVRLETQTISDLDKSAQAAHTTRSNIVRQILTKEFQAMKPMVAASDNSVPIAVNNRQLAWAKVGHEWFPRELKP